MISGVFFFPFISSFLVDRIVYGCDFYRCDFKVVILWFYDVIYTTIKEARKKKRPNVNKRVRICRCRPAAAFIMGIRIRRSKAIAFGRLLNYLHYEGSSRCTSYDKIFDAFPFLKHTTIIEYDIPFLSPVITHLHACTVGIIVSWNKEVMKKMSIANV